MEDLEGRTLLSVAPNARPKGGEVVAGVATIAQTGTTTTIDQSSGRAIINWTSFDIGSNQRVVVEQPDPSSITFIRTDNSRGSQIAGHLTANGRVILISPNGVLFYQGSQVNDSGLIATTAGIRDGELTAETVNFSQPGRNANAAIVNRGTITAGDGGLVGFVGPKAENGGVITASEGRVTLASGDTFTLDTGDDRITAAASGLLTSQQASNSGTIQADAGTVTISAAAGGVANSQVINSGKILAKSVGNRTGQIILAAASTGRSRATNSGTLTASGTPRGQTGGAVTVTADDVKLTSGSVIDASGGAGGGYVKVGGDFHGQGGTPTALHTTVQSGATIKAGAITSGDGGKVAVWSDQKTIFDGAITARGGATSGNGGSVETSGHTLVSKGSVDVSAPHGNAGTWLLDPTDLTIGQSSGTGGANAESISAALSGGSNVTITATGSITLSGNITDSGSGTTTLDFEAGTGIVVSSGYAITESGAGKLNVTFDAATGGAISVRGHITTGGGNIIMGGRGNPSLLAAVGDSTYVNGITLDAATLNAGGNMTLLGTGNVAAPDDNYIYGVYAHGGAKKSRMAKSV